VINGHRYSLNCDVVEDSELAYISRGDLTHLVQSDTGAAMKLLDLLSTEIQALRTALAQPSRTIRKGRTCVKRYLN
jgi:CRP-like cAMP-binding protein